MKLKDFSNKLETLVPLCDYFELLKFRYKVPENEVLNGDYEIDQEMANHDITLLEKGYPPPYLVGSVEFCSRRYNISESVLIPRMETEELVYNILKIEGEDSQSKGRVLDLCSGSGVIAISLAKSLPSVATVVGYDISLEALAVARENARLNEADIKWVSGDFIHDPWELGVFDIIVSNPPYIPSTTKLDNSLDYEPQIALFGGEDGLEFYKRFASVGYLMVGPKTRVYFETGPDIAGSVKTILSEAFSETHEIVIVKDMSKKDRFVYVLPKAYQKVGLMRYN